MTGASGAVALMFAPSPFAIDDPEVVADLLARAPLATLIVATPEGLEAAHLPLLYDAASGVLSGHLARANPLARMDGVQALAVFSGAQAYVSPGFYPSKRAHGRVVPTWNYEAVHVHGGLERFDEPGALRAVVAALSDRFEAERPQPWSVDDAPEPYLAGMLRAIVGVRLHAQRIEGVRKLSQNRDAADRAGVREGLSGSGRPGDRVTAALMETLEQGHGEHD